VSSLTGEVRSVTEAGGSSSVISRGGKELQTGLGSGLVLCICEFFHKVGDVVQRFSIASPSSRGPRGVRGDLVSDRSLCSGMTGLPTGRLFCRMPSLRGGVADDNLVSPCPLGTTLRPAFMPRHRPVPVWRRPRPRCKDSHEATKARRSWALSRHREDPAGVRGDLVSDGSLCSGMTGLPTGTLFCRMPSLRGGVADDAIS